MINYITKKAARNYFCRVPEFTISCGCKLRKNQGDKIGQLNSALGYQTPAMVIVEV
jgi:hypothetical protein